MYLYNNNSPAGQEEVPIMSYKIHKKRLIPLLVKTYAMVMHFLSFIEYHLNSFLSNLTIMIQNSTIFSIRNMWIHRSNNDFATRARQTKEVHIIASGMKALSSWHVANTVQMCREACGGHGN